VFGDRGYDADAIRRGLRARHIVSCPAMRRTKHGSGLGRWRWVVERTFAWLNQFRLLRVRYDKRSDIHEAFFSLACPLICWHSLPKNWQVERITRFSFAATGTVAKISLALCPCPAARASARTRSSPP
jgi:hypothetical protein